MFKIADLVGLPSSQSAAPPTSRRALARPERSAAPPSKASIPVRWRKPPHPAVAPKIVYPPDGALIEWHGEELSLDGERRQATRSAGWSTASRCRPDCRAGRFIGSPIAWASRSSPVIDAEGRSARSTVRLSQ